MLFPAGTPLMVVAMTFLGIGRGGLTIMRATLVANRYGTANFGAISGIPAAAQMAARASAPLGGGLLVSGLGGYQAMLVVLTVVGIAATIAMVIFVVLARPLRLYALPEPTGESS